MVLLNIYFPPIGIFYSRAEINFRLSLLEPSLPHANVKNDERIWERHEFKMAATDLNEMRRHFENNSRTKDFVAHTAKVCKEKLLCGV